MNAQFFYTIIIAFASGIFFRSFFDMGTPWVLWLMALAAGGVGAWMIMKGGRQSLLLFLALACASCALGVFRLDVTDRQVSPFASQENTEVVLEGVIVREPDVREKTVHLYVRENATQEILLVTTDPYRHFVYGDRVSIEGTLKKPESFETDLGRTFNYEGFLKARGVTHMVQFADVKVRAQGEGNLMLSILFEGKHAFLSVLEGIIPEPAAGLGEGLLLGVKALGSDLEDIFRQVGIIHIVVLSGYNIMIVVESVMWILSFWFFPRTRMVIGLTVIGMFALLVGLSASVVRASIMAALLIIARATGRTYAIVRALMLAGFVMLLINPYLLAFDPGFQLSFLATLGLLLLAPRINERLRFVPSFAGTREFLTATIATQIFVLPLLLYQMGMFSLVAVVANTLVLPAVPFAMLFVFVTGAVAFLTSGLAVGIGFSAYILLSYIVVVAETLAKIPYAWVSVPSFPFWVVVLAYAVLALFLVLTNKQEIEGELETLEPTNDYSDWTIEVEEEVYKKNAASPPALRAGGDARDSLPFR